MTGAKNNPCMPCVPIESWYVNQIYRRIIFHRANIISFTNLILAHGYVSLGQNVLSDMLRNGRYWFTRETKIYQYSCVANTALILVHAHAHWSFCLASPVHVESHSLIVFIYVFVFLQYLHMSHSLIILFSSLVHVHDHRSFCDASLVYVLRHSYNHVHTHCIRLCSVTRTIMFTLTENYVLRHSCTCTLTEIVCCSSLV